MPSMLQSKPKLPDHLKYYWAVWQDLSGDRQSGMSVGLIPFTAVVAYSQMFGIAGEEFRTLFENVRRIDSIYLSIFSPQKDK